VKKHYVNDRVFSDFMGDFVVGDECLEVLKYEPVSVGASHFTFTDKCIPVFTDDIRVREIVLDDVAIRRSRRDIVNTAVSRRTDEQFVLSSATKNNILSKLSDDPDLYFCVVYWE